MEKFEIREPDKINTTSTSMDKWENFKTHIPLDGLNEEGELIDNGSYQGSFLCVVKRVYQEDVLGANIGDEYITVEMCYYNSLTESFQDQNREFVNVKLWKGIPKI